MTQKERMLAVFEGKKPDKIPWAPRLEIWYETRNALGTMPERYRGMSLKEIQKALRVGVSDRYQPYKAVFKNVEIKEEASGNEIRRTYMTPVGTATEAFKVNSGEESAKFHFASGQYEYLIKGLDDYKAVMYMVENLDFQPAYEGFAAYEKEVGDLGVTMTRSPQFDPMYTILHDYIGYNNAYFELADNLNEVEALYELLSVKIRSLHEIFMNCGAKVLVHGSHYDSMMTPPPVFDKYMKPYLKYFSDKAHENKKIHAVHADADSKLLLNSFLEAGIDMADCLCTAPMSRLTLEEALDVWGDKMVIYGGIPSNLLCEETCGHDDFVDYINNMFEVLGRKKNRVILGVSDNVMPEADIARVEMISEMVEKFSY